MLTLHPTPPPPFRPDPAFAEIARIWSSLDTEGRKLLLAHGRGLVDVPKGAGRKSEPRL